MIQGLKFYTYHIGNKMKNQNPEKPNIINQIVRFGIVGVLSTIIDFVIYTLLCNVFGIPYLIAGLCGFCISLIANYLMSMAFVFKRRDDMSRTREFLLFAGMSMVGLGLNELILFICIDVIYSNWTWLNGWLPISFANVCAKAAATGFVMVYKFISRKLVLEQRSP